MAFDKSLDPILSWGDTILVRHNAPKRYKPGQIGCICGIRNIESAQVSEAFDQPMQSILYLVEFSNGEALEIPKLFVELRLQKEWN